MRHFDNLSEASRQRLFAQHPAEVDPFNGNTGIALGATLYTPATRPALAECLIRQRARGVVSMVLDLEDALHDDDVTQGEANIVRALAEVRREAVDVPLIFVRPRRLEQIPRLTQTIGTGLAGFVLPKFDTSGPDMLDAVAASGERHGQALLAMPIVEGSAVAYVESRRDCLAEMSRIIGKHADLVPCIRIGATDLSGLFGLRRGPDLTVYDLAVVRDAIGDIINTFARPDSPVSVVTGCVWEHFNPTSRVLKPQLRTSPFTAQGRTGDRLRAHLVAADADALVHEVVLDKANGLVGKTVIHPSHTPIVHSLLAVTAEEHQDALAILADTGGGVVGSDSRNKMNERRPHGPWARRILARATAFGVLHEHATFADLLAAHEKR